MDTTHGADGADAAVVRYGIGYAGHDVEVRLPRDAAGPGQPTVLLDGGTVGAGRLTRRTRGLSLVTADGVEIRLHIASGSGDVRPCVRLRRADGYWIDLEPRPAAPG